MVCDCSCLCKKCLTSLKMYSKCYLNLLEFCTTFENQKACMNTWFSLDGESGKIVVKALMVSK